MKPIYKITANSTNVTANFRKAGLIRITIVDQRGHESDSLEIVVNDIGGQTYWPTKGTELRVEIGFESTGLYDKGLFIVDEVKHSGPPDKITITARAADLLKSLKVTKNRSWHQKTLGEIIQAIANEHGLTSAIASKYLKIEIKHIDQSESDINLITRLAKQYDAVAKPAGGSLVFVPKGEKITASGKKMPVFTIHRSDGDSHDYTEAGRTEYTGVKAGWNDKKGAKLKYEKAGTEENSKTLRTTYPTASEAKSAAEAQYKKLTRDASTMSITLKLGKPECVAEGEVNLSGYRKRMLKPWVLKQVTHTLDSRSGLSGNLTMELPNS